MTYFSLSATAINEFMDCWRTNWPDETVSPKMHMLEEHMIPFLEKWKLGCGFYGEQGKIRERFYRNF